MSYGQVVSELSKSLGSEIIGYDNLPEHGGCILYMKGPVKRFDITIEALELGPTELAQFIRDAMADASAPNLRVGVVDGSLVML